MKVLVTGGAGYIGSHTCVELLEAGHEVFVIDNLSNGHEAALGRVQNITKCKLQFINLDIRDTNALDEIFNTFWADSLKSFEKMSWKPKRSIKKICEDTWRWYKNNSKVYDFH